jgi:hypothetical protein
MSIVSLKIFTYRLKFAIILSKDLTILLKKLIKHGLQEHYILHLNSSELFCWTLDLMFCGICSSKMKCHITQSTKKDLIQYLNFFLIEKEKAVLNIFYQ